MVDHLDTGHRHQEATGEDLFDESQQQLDEDVLELSGIDAEFDPPNLPLETPNLQLAFDEVKRMSFYVEETDRLQESVDALEAELDRQITTLKADLDARSLEAGSLAEEVTALRAEADDYLRQLVELREKLPVKLMTKASGIVKRH